MPTYDYACHRCESSATMQFVPVDHPVPHCPVCGELMKLVLHPPALSFKGAGFYETDYKRGERHE